MLTPEKIEEIKKQLMDLGPEEQQEKLKELLATLNPEEQEQLVGKRECPFCLMGQGKIPVKTVYEDGEVKAILDINPANKGHILLFPKDHAGVLAQVPDNIIKKMFSVANKLATAMFEATKAAGTNILVANGPVAGQTAPHVIVNIIPRFEGDKIAIGWQPTKADDAELESLAEKIKNAMPKTDSPTIKEIVEEDLPTEAKRIP
jgi:histidine triad (HIT) family protein